MEDGSIEEFVRKAIGFDTGLDHVIGILSLYMSEEQAEDFSKDIAREALWGMYWREIGDKVELGILEDYKKYTLMIEGAVQSIADNVFNLIEGSAKHVMVTKK